VSATTEITDLIDVAHWELGGNVEAAAAHGLVALWAKSTQGVGYVDPSYEGWRKDSRDAGILFGSYAFGTNQHSGTEQADYFLAHSDRASLLCLDWENNPNAPKQTMDLAHAEEFVARVHEITGRWPVLYSGRSFLDERRIPSSSVLGHCPLWLAQYGEEPKHTPKPWAVWDLWQYTNSAAGPHDETRYPRRTPGFGIRCDRSVWRGDLASLREWWANCGRERGPACRTP
jgi:lysozyme